MTDDDRCPWSDLPKDQCAHCDPEPRPAPWKPTTGRDLTMALIREASENVAVTIATRPPAPKARDIGTGRAEGLLDYVVELCDWTRHGEPYQVQHANPDGTHTFVTQRHVTTSAPLLQQLAAALSTTGAEDGGGSHAFESKSPARDDAIVTLMTIDDGTYDWLRRVEGGQPHLDHPRLIPAVRHLGSVAVGKLCGLPRGRKDKETHEWCCVGHHIEGDLRTWHTQARITTGWDSPAWKPANTCPLCGTKGSLRVRREERFGMCTKCRSTWTPDMIGLLADHIRAENNDPFNPLEEEDDTPEGQERLA